LSVFCSWWIHSSLGKVPNLQYNFCGSLRFGDENKSNRPLILHVPGPLFMLYVWVFVGRPAFRWPCSSPSPLPPPPQSGGGKERDWRHVPNCFPATTTPQFPRGGASLQALRTMLFSLNLIIRKFVLFTSPYPRRQDHMAQPTWRLPLTHTGQNVLVDADSAYPARSD